MQRKTFHLVAVALLVVGVVAGVIGGVGDGVLDSKKSDAPARAAAKPGSPPAAGTMVPPTQQPSGPVAAAPPGEPAWSFAPRRPVDDSVVAAAPGGPMGAAQGPAGSTGSSVPGGPGMATPGMAPGAPASFNAPNRQNPPGLSTMFQQGPPTGECPRGTLVRAGSSGPEVICANP